MGILVAVLFACLIPIGLEGRPISYSGGSTLMAFSDSMRTSLYYHYSPTYKYSMGIEVVRDKYLKTDYSYFRFAYLLDRKNTDRSQRNLYFQSGVSSEGFQNYFYGIYGDWETRRWFTGFSYKTVGTDKLRYVDQSYQFGVAPYLGDYGDLHSWIMLKTKKNSLKGGWSTYPVLKFFKGDALIEFGYNKRTHWDAHIMYRF